MPASQSLVFKEDFCGKAPGSRPGTEWVCNAASFFPPKYIHMSPHPSDSVLRYIAAWWRQYYQCLLLGESLIYVKMLIEWCGLHNNGPQKMSSMQPPEPVNLLALHGKRDLIDGRKFANQLTLSREIVVDYPGWPNIITWALKGGRRRQRREKRGRRDRRDSKHERDLTHGYWL